MIITAHAWALLIMLCVCIWQFVIHHKLLKCYRTASRANSLKDIEITSLSAMLTKRNQEISGLYKQQALENRAQERTMSELVTAHAALKEIAVTVYGPKDFTLDAYPTSSDKIERITDIIEDHGDN